MSVDARKERFELVEVFDRPMLFTCLRVDRNTVPKGLYLYEVRNDDDQCGIPVEIGRWIMVNHWGTLLSATPIKLEPNRYNNNAYRHIDPENDWNYTGDLCSAKEYMDKYLLKKDRENQRKDRRCCPWHADFRRSRRFTGRRSPHWPAQTGGRHFCALPAGIISCPLRSRCWYTHSARTQRLCWR